MRDKYHASKSASSMHPEFGWIGVECYLCNQILSVGGRGNTGNQFNLKSAFDHTKSNGHLRKVEQEVERIRKLRDKLCPDSHSIPLNQKS